MKNKSRKTLTVETSKKVELFRADTSVGRGDTACLSDDTASLVIHRAVLHH